MRAARNISKIRDMTEFCKTHGSTNCPWDVFDEPSSSASVHTPGGGGGGGGDTDSEFMTMTRSVSVETGLSSGSRLSSHPPDTGGATGGGGHDDVDARGGPPSAAPGERKLKFQGREAKEKEILSPEQLRQHRSTTTAEASSSSSSSSSSAAAAEDHTTKGGRRAAAADDHDGDGGEQDAAAAEDELADIDPYYWADTSQMKIPIVIDNGTGYLKAGFAGEQQPSLIIPNVLAAYPSTRDKKSRYQEESMDPAEEKEEEGAVNALLDSSEDEDEEGEEGMKDGSLSSAREEREAAEDRERRSLETEDRGGIAGSSVRDTDDPESIFAEDGTGHGGVRVDGKEITARLQLRYPDSYLFGSAVQHAAEGLVDHLPELRLNPSVFSDAPTNWDDVEELWLYVYRNLEADPTEHPVLMTQPTLPPLKLRDDMFEVLFDRLHVPAAYIATAPLLAAYAYGASSGLVIDVGDSSAQIAPIMDGYVLDAHVRRVKHLGGRRDTAAIMSFLRSRRMGLQTLVTSAEGEAHGRGIVNEFADYAQKLHAQAIKDRLSRCLGSAEEFLDAMEVLDTVEDILGDGGGTEDDFYDEDDDDDDEDDRRDDDDDDHGGDDDGYDDYDDAALAEEEKALEQLLKEGGADVRAAKYQSILNRTNTESVGDIMDLQRELIQCGEVLFQPMEILDDMDASIISIAEMVSLIFFFSSSFFSSFLSFYFLLLFLFSFLLY